MEINKIAAAVKEIDIKQQITYVLVNKVFIL